MSVFLSTIYVGNFEHRAVNSCFFYLWKCIRVPNNALGSRCACSAHVLMDSTDGLKSQLHWDSRRLLAPEIISFEYIPTLRQPLAKTRGTAHQIIKTANLWLPLGRNTESWEVFNFILNEDENHKLRMPMFHHEFGSWLFLEATGSAKNCRSFHRWEMTGAISSSHQEPCPRPCSQGGTFRPANLDKMQRNYASSSWRATRDQRSLCL